MSYFDFLIQEGKEPKAGMEYIYRFHIAFKANQLESFSLEPNIIVDNVVSTRDSSGQHTGYNFTIKGTTEVLHCSYAWAFAENTPENVARIQEYDNFKKRYLELAEKHEELFNSINTLKV